MSWDSEKTLKTLRGAVIAILGASGAALVSYLELIDLQGIYGPFLGAFLSVLVNSFRLYLKPSEEPTDDVSGPE